jgi:hypothetical protein
MRGAAFLPQFSELLLFEVALFRIVLALAVALLLTALHHGKASGDDQAIDVGTGLGKRTAPASASSLPPVCGSVQLHLLGLPVNLLDARSAWRKASA